MAQAEYRTLSKRVLDRLSVNGKDAIFWDRDLAGFGIRVYPSGKKVFVVQTRAFGRSKRVTLGRYPELTPDRLPGLVLRPLPVEFGRYRYRTGFVARRSAEELPPFRRFEAILRDTALGRRG